MDKLKELARILAMAVICVPLCLIVFVIVGWHFATDSEAGFPFRGRDADCD